MTIAIKIAGPCDTTGCPYPATVHYGLEEFYCEGCHIQNAAEQRRWEKAQKDRQTEFKWARAIFDAMWPNFCRSCGASGSTIYYENHGVPGPGEQVEDACEKCEGGCPRCRHQFPEAALDKFYEDSEACPVCGWRWGMEEGDTCPEYDGP